MNILQKIAHWLEGIPTMTVTNGNRKAFLTTIAVSEGTEDVGDHGYNILFGSTKENPRTFSSYKDHPNISTFIPRLGIYSSAAGRYQIIYGTYEGCKRKLNLPDFSPNSQDLIALELIRERGALGDVDSGDIEEAIRKCAGTWASLPGAIAPGQRQNKMADLVATYKVAGGTT